MSLNKEALIRYRTIDNCLRNRGKKLYTLTELQEAIEQAIGKTISISMLQKDIYAMRYDEALAYNAPIEYDRARQGYYYSQADYSILSLPLNEREMESLQIAAQTLKQYSARGIFKHFDDAIEKIKQAVSMSNVVEDDIQIIQFEQATPATGSQWITELYTVIKESKPISIQYKKIADEAPKTYKLDPYLLKEYKQRWYIIGREHSKNSIQTFGLDRVYGVTLLPGVYVPDTQFHAAHYFKYSLGISRSNDAEPSVIRLKFGHSEAHFIRTQPIHHSQAVLEQTADYLIIELTLYENYELLSWILSYGKNIEVLSPDSLRKKIAYMIKDMENTYN